MERDDLETALKKATKRYRETTTLGKRLPLTILRAIYRQAFLDGSRFVLESLGAKLPEKKR